jgi:hypothetical protein
MIQVGDKVIVGRFDGDGFTPLRFQRTDSTIGTVNRVGRKFVWVNASGYKNGVRCEVDPPADSFNHGAYPLSELDRAATSYVAALRRYKRPEEFIKGAVARIFAN